MVAFVSGNALGLFNSSLGVLGGQGAAGNAGLGRSGEQAYVNVATGNLLLQRRDELLIGMGPDVNLVRTYNSAGLLDDDNGDNWRLGLHKRLHGLTGTLNTAGSTVRRTDGDGAELIYTYDTTRSAYINRDGSGSLDTLVYSGGTWTWTDGDSRVQETYDWINGSGKLLSLSDTDGHALTYSYTGSLLTLVTDASGERTYLDYSGANLTALRTVDSSGHTLTRVRYGYDSHNRLTSVTVDLTPEDNSIADGQVYTTSYTYDGDSRRIAGLTQTDGTRISFSYLTLADGTTRVAQIVQTVEGGERITSLAYDIENHSTTVTDPLGYETVYRYDSQGRLIELQGPASGTAYSYDGYGRLIPQPDSPLATRHIRYAYDLHGNLTQQTDALGRTISYHYDDNGNLTLQRDALGNTVTRTYGSRNELLTETVYATPDPDGAGAGQPGQAQTTRYAYDSQNHLRFVVTAEGRVTEYRYNAQGQRIASLEYAGTSYAVGALAEDAPLAEATLANWTNSAALDPRQILRTDSSYDFRGQVSTITRYTQTDSSGVGMADGTQSATRYIYDQSGRLLQTVQLQGAGPAADGLTTSYTYDGLGRLLGTTDAAGHVTLHQYDDAANTTTVLLANGLATTSTYNRAGELISVLQADGAQALGETKYTYDKAGRLRMTEDPLGVRKHILYDEAGRKVGEIDGNGSLTEYVYNAADQVVATIRYSSVIWLAKRNSLIDSEGNPTSVTLADIRPGGISLGGHRVTSNLYDAAGRLSKTIDELGFVTEIHYDGASRPIASIRYANAIAMTGITTDTKATDAAVTPVADSLHDRRTRTFYDQDGNIQAVLDAEGYLSEHQYDAAGRLIHTVSYATPTPASDWAEGTLEQLRPAVDPAQDRHEWTRYDGQGRVIARIDGEGYLTETLYDVHGNPTRQTRYAGKALLDPAVVTADTPLESLRPAAQNEDRVTTWTYTHLHQVQTRTDPQGTVTRYTYDSVGNLVQTETALGTAELRAVQFRYDKQGRLTGELTAEGSAALAALSAPTTAQIDAIWTQYGITHAYDQAGQRISSIDQNGNRTLFYYNEDGRLVHSINALGEVVTNHYTQYGDLWYVTRYGARIDESTLATFTGGVVTSAVSQAITAITNDAPYSTVSYSHDRRGQVVSTSDELGNQTTYSYNAFGELSASTEQIDATHSVVTTYDVDRRGLVTQVTEDSGGLNRITQSVYDAFGRVVQRIDGNHQVTQQQFDRIGRLVQTTDALDITRSTTYDAFGRVLTQQDGNGNITSTAYDKHTRTTTVTTAEGIQIATTVNRHGETVQLQDGRGNTTRYSYDRNGNLVTTTHDGLGITESKRYDNADRLIETTDAKGIKTLYSYDAAHRLLSRTVDPEGLALTTTYAYDAKGQVVSVTDPNHVVTQTSYDRKGQVVQVTVDPAGLNLQTTYSYDARGKRLTMTEGAGTDAARVTQYTYDALGRRIQEVTDPAGLHLATHYAYDDNDNLIGKTDAAGHVTRYVYDADNRLVYTVDPLGHVTEQRYDAQGRIIGQIRYARPLTLAALAATPALADVAALLEPGASDQITRTVHDKDGRALYRIDAQNYVTQTAYDANGNIVGVTQYAHPITLPQTLTVSTLETAVAAAASSADRLTRHVFDAANRLVYSLSAAGTVTENVYDANGNLIETIAYAAAMDFSGTPTAAAMQAFVATHADSAQDRRTRHVIDAANRVRYTIDAMGYVQQRDYDAAGHVTRTVRYAAPVAASGPLSLDTLATLLPATLPANAVVERQTWDAAGRLIDTLDGQGTVTRRIYDAGGRLIDLIQAYGTADASHTRRSYDAAGRMTAETRAYGTSLAATTRYHYDPNGHIVQTIDPRGIELAESDSDWAQARRRELGYVNADGSARLAADLTAFEQATLHALYATTQVFDAAGRKIQVTDPMGGVTTTAYDAFGNAVKVTDPRGHSGYFYFDGLNRNTVQIDPEGFVTRTDYTLGDKPTRITQYAQRATGTWDETTAPVVLETAPSGTSSAPYVLQNPAKDQVTTLAYDKLERLTQATDAMGYYEAYTYDALGNRTSLRNKVGGLTTYAYDLRGNLIAETLPITSANAAGQQVAVVHRHEYDARGNRIKTIEAAGLPEQRITTFEFDALDRQVRKIGEALSIFNPVTKTTSTVTPVETQRYDARGNLIETIDANGQRTLAYYDALDRKTAEINAVGSLTVYQYHAGKEPIAQRTYGTPVTLPAVAGGLPPAPVNATNVRETLYTYDRNERLVATTLPAVHLGRYDAISGQYQLYTADIVTRQIYDANGNVIQSIDGNGNATTTFYDRVGQKILQVDAEGYGIAWRYDVNGNVLREQRYATKYPALVTPDSDAHALLAGWPTDDSDRITEYAYDRKGQLISEHRLNVTYATVGGAGGTVTQTTGSAVTHYLYNGLGQILQKTDANGGITDTMYDSLGRKTREQGAAFTDFEGTLVRPTTDTEYNGLNDVVRSIQRGKNNASEADDLITRYQYGTGARLTSETDATGAVTTFAYDAAGNVTRKQRPRSNADGVTVTDTTYYRYDGLQREIEHSDAATGVSQQTRYNAYGEISAKGTNGGWQEFAEYDQAGRVFKSNASDGVTKAYLYDAAGNATLTIESSGPDLKPMTLDQMLGLSNGNPSPDALDAAGVHLTISAFDRRNQLTDTFQPKMVTSHEATTIESSSSTVQLATGSYTGVTVSLGAASQTSSIPATNPLDTGKVGVSSGNVQLISSFFGRQTHGTSSSVAIIQDVYVKLQVTLPTAAINQAWGNGQTVIEVNVAGGKVKDWGGSGTVYPVPNQTYYFPSTQSVIDIEKIVGQLSAMGSTIGKPTVLIYKQTDYGNVLLSQFNPWFSVISSSNNPSVTTYRPIPKLVHFNGQPSSTNRLVMWYRPAGSSGPYQQMDVPKYAINGNPVNGWFAFDYESWVTRSNPDGSLVVVLPPSHYDIKYVALDAAGNILNQEAGSMTLAMSNSSIVQSPRPSGPTQPDSYFFQSGNLLNLSAQGTNARSMTVRYRPLGSTGAWTTAATLNPATLGGAVTPGWFKWNYGTLAGDYEVIFESRTSTGALVNKLHSKLRLNGTASQFLTGLTAYQNLPSTVTFGGNPSDATALKLGYRLQGSTGAYTEVTLDPTASGTGTFRWDASDLVPYDRTDFKYEFVYEVVNASGQIVNKGGGAFQLGTTPAMLGQYVAPSESQLSFQPAHPDAARMALHYRVRGSTGDYLPVPVLDKSSDGKFHWPIEALKPDTGSAAYEYFYDLYDADGHLLGRTSGYLTAGDTSSANELKWVVTGLVGGEHVIHRSQVVNAFGEVIQEIDGLGRATDFSYNTLGHLVSKRDPQTQATLDNGFIQTLRPQTLYYYDRMGQLLGVKDANGHLNTQTWLAGDLQKVRTEHHADGGAKSSGYDIFGNVRIAVDELNRRTDYYYDKANRLIRIERPQRDSSTAGYIGYRTYDLYAYDAAGNRIAHTNSQGYRERTYYDSLGRVTQTTSNAGRITRYTYTYLGSILGVGGSAVGGFRKVTTDANGRTLIDDQDVFGRLTWHQDLGGRTFSYGYNNAGWLTLQTGSSGQHITYAYYANGFIKAIRDHAEHTLTSYEYDSEGNKTFEGYATLQDDNQTIRDYHQQASITYDALNRVKTVTDPRYTISYEYDAVGNRRRVVSTYHDGVNGNLQTQDYWYKYDSMNRFTVTMGSLSGARAASATDATVGITRGTTGTELAYDAAGQRRQAIALGDDGIVHTEDYSYTSDGYLADTRIDGRVRARRTNDALGRVTIYVEYNTGGSLTYRRTWYYDADNLTTSELDDNGRTTYYRYADGTLEHLSTTSKDNTTVTTYYGYEWWDSAKESTVTATPYNSQAPGWKSGYSHMVYDVNGHLKEARDEVGNRSFRYINNAEGLVMLRDEIANNTVNKHHSYYYLDGKRIGDVGNDGPTRIDYVQSLAQDRSLDRKQAYRNFKPISSADFDQNYEPINPNYPGNASSTHTVRQGETLQRIAAQVWGDASMWYLLADANGLTGQEALTAGTVLTIPNKVANIHNNSGTFRVYSAGEAIGDTSPTLPDAPPPPRKSGGGCGGFAKIFVAVIAIVATVATAGLLAAPAGSTLGAIMSAGVSALGGSIGTAMVAGAVGSVVSQGVAMAIGIQDKFSWSGVALNAIGAGVGAGLGGAIGGQTLVPTMQRAVAGNVITQGVAVATGLQKKFDWRGVAASALGSAAGYGVGRALSTFDPLVSRTAAGLAHGGVSSLASGQKPNWGAIAATSFGSTLGDSIVDSLKDGTFSDAIGKSINEDIDNAGQQTEKALGSGLDPYRSSALGLRISESTYAEWANRTNEGILQGASQLQKMEDLSRELNPPLPEYELLAAAGTGGPLVQKQTLPPIEGQRRYAGGVAQSASMGWREAMNPNNSLGERLIYGGLSLAATPLAAVESLLYAPLNVAPAAHELGQVAARASLQTDPTERNLDILRGVSLAAEGFTSAGAWIGGVKLQAGQGESYAAMRATYTVGESIEANSVASAKNYGVTFFGDDILQFYGPTKATIGNPNGAPSFFMTLEDSALVKNAHDAATYTGMAPSAQKAYLTGGEINGFSFPIDGLKVTKPTTLDAGGWPHYLEGGNTAVKLEGPNAGYMITPVKEFITPGNSPVPKGSVLFKVGPSGEWIPLRKW